MQSIDGDQRERFRPLFAGFPGLHGGIESVLEGVLGEAFVDDRDEPQIARLAFDDFHCVAGNPDKRGAAAALLAIPDGDHVVIAEGWRPRLIQTRDARPYDRFAFASPGRWDREKLAALRDGLPDGYALERVTAETVAAFEELNETFVSNFRSNADFLERGVGFGIRKRAASEFVAGCASYTISSRYMEFEIETHADYQRRGLALVAGARMIDTAWITGWSRAGTRRTRVRHCWRSGWGLWGGGGIRRTSWGSGAVLRSSFGTGVGCCG